MKKLIFAGAGFSVIATGDSRLVFCEHGGTEEVWSDSLCGEDLAALIANLRSYADLRNDRDPAK